MNAEGTGRAGGRAGEPKPDVPCHCGKKRGSTEGASWALEGKRPVRTRRWAGVSKGKV